MASDYEIQIIDCRFEYEFEGGHIRGAKNIPILTGVLNQFFESGDDLQLNKKVIIVFHCEFSSKRAPETYDFVRHLTYLYRLKALRKIDRHKNLENWPNLYYPELYLLEGGYSAFWAQYPHYCDPQGYVKMVDDGERSKRGHLERRNSSHDLFEEVGLAPEREWPSGRRASRSPRGSSGSPMRSPSRPSPRFLDRLTEVEEKFDLCGVNASEPKEGEDPSLLSSIFLSCSRTGNK